MHVLGVSFVSSWKRSMLNTCVYCLINWWWRWTFMVLYFSFLTICLWHFFVFRSTLWSQEFEFCTGWVQYITIMHKGFFKFSQEDMCRCMLFLYCACQSTIMPACGLICAVCCAVWCPCCDQLQGLHGPEHFLSAPRTPGFCTSWCTSQVCTDFWIWSVNSFALLVASHASSAVCHRPAFPCVCYLTCCPWCGVLFEMTHVLLGCHWYTGNLLCFFQHAC